MAHVGQAFKVHLRRDMCIGCTDYRKAVGEAQRMSILFSAPPTVPTVYNVERLLATLTTDPAEFPIVWETEAITQHTRTFNLRCIFDDYNLTTQLIQMTGQIVSSGTVRASWTMRNQAPGSCIACFLTSGNTFTTYDAAYWGTSNHFVIGGSTEAAFWNVYPP